MPVRSFRKASTSAPAGYFAWEAAGLRWLASVSDGAPVVEVESVGPDYLELDRLESVPPDAAAAEAFGAALARTHAAGAPAYGSAPAGWTGDGWLGPAAEPLPLLLRPVDTWAELYAHQRIAPLLRVGRDSGVFSAQDATLFERLMGRLDAGELADEEAPSCVHGDLWAGNLMWTRQGVVLIDCAAHGGHREGDLAYLALFATPHLEVILSAYDAQRPLAPGWRDRVALHQVHPLMLHAVLFGGGYIGQSLAAARRYA